LQNADLKLFNIMYYYNNSNIVIYYKILYKLLQNIIQLNILNIIYFCDGIWGKYKNMVFLHHNLTCFDS